ncbi:MAG: ZIP family metal transporter [Candidatus Shapirobacteria bacterium]|nr:ZIP family metal transporter [Candidatus Shapirobacteria bacterium]
MIWFFSLISVFIISLISFVGVLFLCLKKEVLQKILFFLVSFAAGSMLGGAFFHLLPEAVNDLGTGFSFSFAVIGGILAFFILEKFIAWRHCHIPTSSQHPHPVVFMNLIGDAFHNFIDGVVVAASFMTSFSLGLTTSLAVIFHEIPQEIGEFSVLIHGGFTNKKALFLNFISALTAVLGAILTLAIGAKIIIFSKLIIPFAAGNFIYIAGSDLIPELHKETKIGKSFIQLLGLLLGVGLMFLLTLNE